MIMTLKPAPIPMPAFVPVEKAEVEVTNEVCEGREVGIGCVDWIVPVSDCTLDEVGAVKEEEKGEDDDPRREFPTMVLDRVLTED